MTTLVKYVKEIPATIPREARRATSIVAVVRYFKNHLNIRLI